MRGLTREGRLVASTRRAPDPFVAPAECWCLGCGCTDRRACAAGCVWLWRELGLGVGLCSNCEELSGEYAAPG